MRTILTVLILLCCSPMAHAESTLIYDARGILFQIQPHATVNTSGQVAFLVNELALGPPQQVLYVWTNAGLTTIDRATMGEGNIGPFTLDDTGLLSYGRITRIGFESTLSTFTQLFIPEPALLGRYALSIETDTPCCGASLIRTGGPTTVPEPTSILLVITGLILAAWRQHHQYR